MPEPFHLYSMRQAIEEGFILDVLQNYTSYKTYFRLNKKIEDDPRLNKKKAVRAIARFVSLHPHNLAQKTEVIIEHFRRTVRHKIGGQAKAMVVTSSRPHVVRYKQHFDDYLAKKGYDDIQTLVAFTSFRDKETGQDYTEAQINGFSESELPQKFEKEDYHLLIVADKYQTGFDQPLLHTMYVDKKLSGVRAVQTLSRLNRIHPGKEETFVLDFVNTEEDIIEAFQPFYEKTKLSGTTDPNKLYDLKAELENYRIIWPNQVTAFAEVFFKLKAKPTKRDHAKLNSFIDPAVDRYKALPEDNQRDDFKNTLSTFVRLYAFVAQIMPFSDEELETFYPYARLLWQKLPLAGPGDRVQLDDDVALEYYRLQKISQGSLALETDGQYRLDPLLEAGSRGKKENEATLSEIIEVLNEAFGLNLGEADRLYFAQLEEALVSNPALAQQAKNNTLDNFRYGFEESFNDAVVDRMDDNQRLFSKIFDDAEFRTLVINALVQSVYQRLNED